jgi:hypothetical protein
LVYGTLSGAVIGAAFLFCLGLFMTGLAGKACIFAGFGAIAGGVTGLLGGPDLGVIRSAALGVCVMTGLTLSLAVVFLEPDEYKDSFVPATVYGLVILGACIGVLARLGWHKRGW